MYLYGASGHGKVIRDIVEACGQKVKGYIDDNHALNELHELPVFHSLEGVDEVLISIGENHQRKRIAEKVPCPIASSVVHPNAVVAPSARIGNGTVVMAGVIINVDTQIGRHCIINTGATVDHECIISDYVHISPHATLCGCIDVGEGAWVGAGAVVIPGIHIGAWSVIGAGSVVVEDIPDGCLAYGNPCRIIKKINKE